MRDSSYRFALALAVLGAAYLGAPCPASAQLSPDEAAGKRFYLEGRSASGSPIEAILNDGDTRVPAHLMPCGSCHGPDGRGRAEGGIAPSDITWGALSHSSRPNGNLTAPRRAYDAISLRHAIVDGLDPDGHPLGLAMPRYQISPRDLNSLIAYLTILGNEPEPGITADRIRIGAVVPASSATTPGDTNLTAVLQAYFDELNEHGGIYNRKLELVTFQTPGPAADIAPLLKQFVEQENIFALLAPSAPGSDGGTAAILERQRVPAIVTFAGSSDANAPESSQVFYLLSGLFQQTDALVNFASHRHQAHEPPPAIVFPERMHSLADYTVKRCRAMSLGDALLFKYIQFDAGSIASSLTRQNLRTVFFLGNGRELQALLNSARDLTVFQPGPLAGQALFDSDAEFADRVFLSFPTLPGDMAPEALEEFHLLLHKQGLSSSQAAPSLLAVASAKVLVEALRQSGRHLTRATVVDALIHLNDFNTGLTPPVSYRPDRRIGALQGYVVEWDGKRKIFVPIDRSLAQQ
jgi:ABC-type branched-subunit amino acid transport system substrate-binding protein